MDLEAGSSRKMHKPKMASKNKENVPQAGPGSSGGSRPETSASGRRMDSGEGTYPFSTQRRNSSVVMDLSGVNRSNSVGFCDLGIKRKRSIPSETHYNKKECCEAFVLKETIQQITKIGKTMTKYIEQNTKRELKDVCINLQKQIEVLNRVAIQRWIADHELEKEEKLLLDADTQTPEYGTVMSLSFVTNYSDFEPLADRDWDRQLCKNTDLKRASPLDTNDGVVKIVLVAHEEQKMESGIQRAFAAQIPELLETTDNINVLEQTNRIKGIEKKRKIVKINWDDSEKDLFGRLQELRKELREDKEATIHEVKHIENKRFRKMLETIFHGTRTAISLMVSETVKSSKFNGARPTYALVVEGKGEESFDSTLKDIKRALGQRKDDFVGIQSIKKTKDGKVLITTDKDENLLDKIKHTIETENNIVKKRTDRQGFDSLFVRGMDLLTEKYELELAINKVILPGSDFKISDLRTASDNTRSAIVFLSKKESDEVLSKRHIRVGLVNCSTSRLTKVPKCRRCWAFDHQEENCHGEDRSKTCYKCGENGHLAKECKNSESCPQELHFQNDTQERTPEMLIREMIANCDKCLKVYATGGKSRPPVYWWNDEIRKARDSCNRLRRTYTRARTSEARRKLKRQIKASREKCWRKLVEELDDNIWGKAYLIVTKRLRTISRLLPDRSCVSEQVTKPFPVKETIVWNIPVEEENNITLFSADELKVAVERLKARKAAGPDGIAAEIIKISATKEADTFLRVFNECLMRGLFPDIWKTARLVLIQKPKKTPEAEKSYKPLCVIDSAGKLLEILIKNRLQEEMEEKGLVKSEIQRKACKNRELCVMILLDIKNAFNAAPWGGIMEALEEGNISLYIRKIISSYLENRRVITCYGEEVRVSCGVPQGSVLGPKLWNLFYNKILNIKTDKGAMLIAYADDLGLVVKAKTQSLLTEKAQHLTDVVIHQLKEMGLSVEPSKTEIVAIEGRRTLKDFKINVDGCQVIESKTVRYLGVHLDRDLTMKEHVRKVTEKATKMTNVMLRLMPKMGGPRQRRRLLLRSAVVSAIAYAAPIWISALRYAKYRGILERVNRVLAIGIISAYRTVSTSAVLVLAEFPPMDLVIEERSEIHQRGRDYKIAARACLHEKWQSRWNGYGGWAKCFVTNVRAWIDAGWSLDYVVTQAFTGHGPFGTYLDTPEHCLFQCEEYNSFREVATMKCGVRVTKENVAQLLLRSEAVGGAVIELLRNIMTTRNQAEVFRQQNQ
ncbi:hypothetical protein HUJ05_001875 [Dendroctonus ponderosae]|nr:hypothetical protein HUJ05_001875 [Dendroctonus ponderosae]